jgi:hypothetical protein
MVSIPTLLLSISYNQELVTYCDKCNTTICTDFKNRNNDWLYTMNGENIKFYTKHLYNITNDGTYDLSDNVIDYGFIYFMVMMVLYVTKYFFVIIVDALVLEIDMLNITPSDYAIMVTNIPQDVRNENVIISDYLTLINEDEPEDIKPTELNITYKIADYIRTKNDFLEIRKKIKQKEFEARNEHNPRLEKYITWLKKKKLNIAKELNDYLADLDNPDKKLFTGVVFATFNTSAQYEMFLDEFPRSGVKYIFVTIQYILYKFLFFSCCDKKKIQKLRNKLTLGVHTAPEPSDILWENLEVSFSERIVRTFLCYLITILILMGSFGIVLGLNIYQSRLAVNDNFTKYLISSLISTIIFIINFIVEVLINFLTDYERNISMSTKYLSNSIKLQLVNLF